MSAWHFQSSHKCPVLSEPALCEVCFCSRFPSAFSAHSPSFRWDASCCCASSCQRPQVSGMLMHSSIYSLHYRHEQHGLRMSNMWMRLKSRVGWGLALWVPARLLQGWIGNHWSSGIIYTFEAWIAPEFTVLPGCWKQTNLPRYWIKLSIRDQAWSSPFPPPPDASATSTTSAAGGAWWCLP